MSLLKNFALLIGLLAIAGSMCSATTRSQSQSLDHKKTYNFTVDLVDDITPSFTASKPAVEEEPKSDCSCSNNRADKNHVTSKQKNQIPSAEDLVLDNVPDVLDIDTTLDNLQKEKPATPKKQKSGVKPKDEADGIQKEQVHKAKVAKPDDRKKNSNRREKREILKAKSYKIKKASYKSKDFGKKQNKHKNGK